MTLTARSMLPNHEQQYHPPYSQPDTQLKGKETAFESGLVCFYQFLKDDYTTHMDA